MDKNILLFSHNTHTFIMSEIKWASKCFDRVLLIAPYSTEFENVCTSLARVEYIPMRNKRIWSMFTGFMSSSKKQVRDDLAAVIKEGKLSVSYLKIMASYLDCELQLHNELKKLRIGKGENWTLLSMWFSATSYAVCRAKESYPELRVVSLAHSFEIDPVKNRYVEHFYKRYCHEKLDGILFISRTVMEQYVHNFAAPSGWRIDNIKLNYLGVEKKCEGLSPSSGPGGPLRLVSCSHCVPVKRLELIIDALATISDIKIQWVHIGGGQEYKSLKARSAKVGSNIDISFAGPMPNEEVHKYFATTPTDAFINVSSSEGLPVSIMEAISYGIPVIATDVGGNSEVVSDKIGKLLGANPTAIEVAQAIQQVLTAPSDKREHFRKRAKELYKTKFMAETVRLEFFKSLSNKFPFTTVEKESL